MPVIQLNETHEQSLADFLAAFKAAGEDRIPGYFPSLDDDHATVLAKLDAWEHGRDLPQGWVPCTTRFLEEEGVLLGVVNVRHTLSDRLRIRGGHVGYSVVPGARSRGHARALLRWASDACAKQGVRVALITTDSDNIASQRVIRACGGRVDRTLTHPVDGRVVVHFALRTPARTRSLQA